MAKNRYGWQKRAKEMARKQKNEDKMKRRQGKVATPEVQESPDGVEGVMTDPVETGFTPIPFPHD